MARIDREELRALVRQALREALGRQTALPAKTLPEAVTPRTAVPPSVEEPPRGRAAMLGAALSKGRPTRVAVTIASSADLDRFARDLIEASGHPDLKAAILSGELGFDLAGGSGPPPAAMTGLVTQPVGGAYQMASGVLSETKLVEIARTHGKIILGSGVVVTPLARDKAREMRIELTRQKP
jgi:hypothetical protein